MARVLVIEDGEDVRSLVVRALMRNGFTVDAAADGEAGIAKLAANDYDAVVLDYMMPRVDGLGVLAWMKRERPHMLRKTAVVSAYVQVIAQQAAFTEAALIVNKPFEIAVLLAAVSACVRATGDVADEDERPLAGPAPL